MKIEIDKELSFYENWYKAKVTYEEIDYPFWFVETVESGRDCYYDIKWFYKQVPREVRGMYSNIIDSFKNRNKEL